MKTLIALLLAAGMGFAASHVMVSLRLNSRHAGGLASQQAAWQTEKEQLQAELEQARQELASMALARNSAAPPGDPKPAGTAPASATATASKLAPQAIIERLKEIGGPEAEQLLAQTLRPNSRPAEVLQLAQMLEQMAPGKYRDTALRSRCVSQSRPVLSLTGFKAPSRRSLVGSGLPAGQALPRTEARGEVPQALRRNKHERVLRMSHCYRMATTLMAGKTRSPTLATVPPSSPTTTQVMSKP